MQVKEQKKTDQFWIDEKGIQVPYSRTESRERLKERSAAKVLTAALDLNNRLLAFKKMCAEACEKAYLADVKENKAPKDGKGGYTLYNFDRSIRIERSINEQIAFEENLIAAAKEKFDEFLTEGTNGVDEMIRQLIMDAFSNSRKGKLDSKKVLSLLAYKTKISEKKYPKFHQALDLIQESIRRPDSRTYYRIWQKAEDGQYVSIDLNFSHI